MFAHYHDLRWLFLSFLKGWVISLHGDWTSDGTLCWGLGEQQQEEEVEEERSFPSSLMKQKLLSCCDDRFLFFIFFLPVRRRRCVWLKLTSGDSFCEGGGQTERLGTQNQKNQKPETLSQFASAAPTHTSDLLLPLAVFSSHTPEAAGILPQTHQPSWQSMWNIYTYSSTQTELRVSGSSGLLITFHFIIPNILF